MGCVRACSHCLKQIKGGFVRNIFGNLFAEKLSRYNYLVDYEGDYLLYNQITGALVKITSVERDDYDRIAQGNFRVPFRFLRMLRHGEYLIKQQLDERTWMREVYEKKTRVTLTKGLTIAITDRCNLGCVYCFEKKTQKIHMTQETQEKLLCFIKHFITATPTKQLTVCWYGGEPTLSLEGVVFLSSKIAAICKEESVKFQQMMITNGTMLTQPVRQQLLDLDIRTLQITIDGSKEYHDLKRPFSVGNASSFDRIWSFLPELYAEGFKVSVRVNLDEKNSDQYELVKQQVEALGVTTKNEKGGIIAIYAARIHNSEDDAEKNAYSQQAFSNSSASRLPKPFSGHNCMADTPWSFAVSQSGVLTKCWGHCTNEQFPIGTIDNLELAEVGFTNVNAFSDEECCDCAVFPICLGGCRNYNGYWGDAPEKSSGCSSSRWGLDRGIIMLYQNAVKMKSQKS
jgi:uncharacterized protein